MSAKHKVGPMGMIEFAPLFKKDGEWVHECPVCGKVVREKPDSDGETNKSGLDNYAKHYLREARNGR